MTTLGHPEALDCDVALGARRDDGATVAVLLHGRGSHKGDLQGLRPHLPPDWTVVTPQGPHAAAAWGYGPGWAWYRYAGDDRVVDETLIHSLDLLGRFLDGLPERVGFAPGRIVLGGFSQGGTTSLSFALGKPGLADAVLVFSGFLPASQALPGPAAAAAAPPVFWGHGASDPAIPLELAERGRARLEAAGVPLTARTYPIGHWIVPEEVRDAVAVVEGLA